MLFILNEREKEREEIFYYSTESSSIGDTAVNCLRNKKGIWNSVTHALLSLGNEIIARWKPKLRRIELEF